MVGEHKVVRNWNWSVVHSFNQPLYFKTPTYNPEQTSEVVCKVKKKSQLLFNVTSG